jgi:non-canonical poly(A) RNA polymerase PAPD5/7
MSGLYLPTADMDLVVCSRQLLQGGPEDERLKAKRALFKFRDFLVKFSLCKEPPLVITQAKVPLVKYVDWETGLQVDVSFENVSGIGAISTFTAWKREHPWMPVLVMFIKQYLVMRGYHEPVNGGIGSFTVICLVTSMLQLTPGHVLNRLEKQQTVLGDLLLEFLDLYGSQFDFENLAIRMKPPGYLRKVSHSPAGLPWPSLPATPGHCLLSKGISLTWVSVQDKVESLVYRNSDRLSVIDPNNPANDISGGSRNFFFIRESFHSAWKTLSSRMDEATAATRVATKAGVETRAAEKGTAASFLQPLIGGDYSSFAGQRSKLREVHTRSLGRCNEAFAYTAPAG